MQGEDVDFLDACRALVRHADVHVGFAQHAGHLAALPASQSDGGNFKFLASRNCRKDITRIATGRYSERHVPLFAQGFDLFGEDFFIVVIVRDAGDGRRVGSESQCRQRRSLDSKTVDELSGYVLRIGAPLPDRDGEDAAAHTARVNELIEQMVRDLDFPVRLVFGETIREHDGLAMSSRNSYLSAEERAKAPVLHRALRAGEEAITHGIHKVADIEKLMHRVVEEEGGVEVDYLAVVDPLTFEAPAEFERDVIVAGAVRVGRTRLIDNVEVNLPR